MRAISSFLLLRKHELSVVEVLPRRNELEGDERRGSRRHSYLRPLLLEPAWAPGQDEIRTTGSQSLCNGLCEPAGLSGCPRVGRTELMCRSFCVLGREGPDGFAVFVRFRQTQNIPTAASSPCASCPRRHACFSRCSALRPIFSGVCSRCGTRTSWADEIT